MSRVVKKPWENGVDDQTRVVLALRLKGGPATVSEVARETRMQSALVRHHIAYLEAREVIVEVKGKPTRYRLQPLFYRDDLLESLYRVLYEWIGQSSAFVVVRDQEDPRGFAACFETTLKLLALDALAIAKEDAAKRKA